MEKSAIEILEVRLSSATPKSRSMSVIGDGTAADPLDSTTLKLAVIEAIKLGYMHFNTAFWYGSKEPLGEAIADAIKLGLVSSRKELFVSSKLWTCYAHANLVIPTIKK